VNYRELLFQKLLAMHDAIVAGAAREANRAITAAPAQPISTAALVPAATAAPAQPIEPKSAEIVDLRTAAMKAGYYISGGGGGQDINGEFPPDPVTQNWLRTSNQAQPKYEPDTTDISGDGIARAFEAQQRRLAKEQSS